MEDHIDGVTLRPLDLTEITGFGDDGFGASFALPVLDIWAQKAWPSPLLLIPDGPVRSYIHPSALLEELIADYLCPSITLPSGCQVMKFTTSRNRFHIESTSLPMIEIIERLKEVPPVHVPQQEIDVACERLYPHRLSGWLYLYEAVAGMSFLSKWRQFNPPLRSDVLYSARRATDEMAVGLSDRALRLAAELLQSRGDRFMLQESDLVEVVEVARRCVDQ